MTLRVSYEAKLLAARNGTSPFQEQAKIERAKMTKMKAADAVAAIRIILASNGSDDAYYNLLGAYIDLERDKADKVCLSTIARVLEQLHKVYSVLDREGATK